MEGEEDLMIQLRSDVPIRATEEIAQAVERAAELENSIIPKTNLMIAAKIIRNLLENHRPASERLCSFCVYEHREINDEPCKECTYTRAGMTHFIDRDSQR